MASTTSRVSQCQKPRGWMGRFVLWRMNAHHSKVTDWGLSHVSLQKHYTLLDVGWGGGTTVRKLADIATEGKVYGSDISSESVAVATRINRQGIDKGCVEIREASVSGLPFADDMFDLITAVETHFWWPDLPGDMREVLRVLKPGGELIVIAEVYKGANTMTSKMAEKYSALTGMKLLSLSEHRELLENAGYWAVRVIAEPKKGWICAIGKKSLR